MGRKQQPVSPRVEKAARLLQNYPKLTDREAMLAAEYTLNSLDNEPGFKDRKRKQIHRHLKKIEEQNPDSSPPKVVHGGLTEDPSPITDACSSKRTSSLTSSSSSSKKPPAKIRRTSKQAQQQRVIDKARNDTRKEAIKEATLLYAENKPKPMSDKTRLSAANVCKIINQKHGTNISTRHIQLCVQNNLVGASPPSKGPPGAFSNVVLKHLGDALLSYIQINQVNGDSKLRGRASLIAKLNAAATLTDCDVGPKSSRLYERIIKVSNIDLKAEFTRPVEDRRRQWTTYSNLKLWFDTWEKSLEHLGFGKRVGNEFVIHDLSRIINLDESCLSLDGSSGRRGGRPYASLYDPALPSIGHCSTKSSVTTTIICGSSAAGEPLPPHFQFSTMAKVEEREKIKLDIFKYL